MKRKLVQCLGFWFALLLLAGCAQKQSEAQSPEGLSAGGQKAMDYLLADWKKQFRSTGIDLAMKNLGLAPNDALRLEVGQYFREHTDLAKNLEWWGANNYILNNDEKVIAKYVINTFDNENRLPNVQEISKAASLSENDVRKRLTFMAKAGLLQDTGNGDLGYALADGYKKWGGPFRYNFHTVTVGEGKPFDVW
ncbi:MAG: hypothetical protein ACE5I1_06795 [bacterium]